MQIVPVSRIPLATRVATLADLPFMDALQKAHSKQLGYFPTKQFEDYIGQGAVLIAETMEPRRREDAEQCAENLADDLMSLSAPPRLRGCISTSAARIGYVIAKDRYLKRDELGVIYQLCVAPQRQRGLIGAALVKAVFERAAYGCRLFCCWCAQDLAANRFWESLGFVPLAFRAGSGKKKRVHIFWQRRIVEGDATPWWYPFQTNSGAIREDRIVFPIPPGVHWSEVKAVELPTCSTSAQPVLPDRRHGLKTRATKAKAPSTGPGPGKVAIIVGGRIKYVDRPGAVGAKPVEIATKPARKKAEKPPKPKYGKKYLSAARELRDRYLEHVNDERLMLPAQIGKYDVSRKSLPHVEQRVMPLLKAG